MTVADALELKKQEKIKYDAITGWLFPALVDVEHSYANPSVNFFADFQVNFNYLTKNRIF